MPEAVGLPVDEQYNYLVMLRRYILYGPSLGITAAHQASAAASAAAGGAQGSPDMQRTLERSGASMTSSMANDDEREDRQ